ncbi:ribosome small subunit-dependent GTPase A [Aliamphritea hakodatensis]|uniref:ribosome small subunit-dependent GTPase A n=1 Tax=Aliamphritea hakodatensis TaxID=2895352 RepID=UPI0022FD8482|nr:ribosome small subunit-dependent GTPase A [Aliamphritea hakodatensis]
MTTVFTLSQLGWSAFFQQQLSLEECTAQVPARIVAQHRSCIDVLTEQGPKRLMAGPAIPAALTLTTGDWLLLNPDGSFYRMLQRRSCFSRKAAGSRVAEQLIAANVDTVFVATALNHDFSLNRTERYLALIREAGADAVVVLTKADLCDDPAGYQRQVQALDPRLVVETVNGLDAASVATLQPWCRAGSTVAVLGSSGVGKSTLINTLLGQSALLTGEARTSDDKGRHTTTARTLHLMNDGGILLDTPGMRELQLADCETGVQETFADITELAERCRYSDCQHQSEPGCAVTEALQAEKIDARRLANYLSLMREQAHNAASLAEKRARDRSKSRYYRSVQTEARQRKKGR